MKIISPALEKTSSVARDTFGVLSRTDSRLVLVDAALFLAVTATAFTAFLVTETGAAILDELHRRHRLRVPRPESPSLRGTPTPKELATACAATPRKLLDRLRLGSLLADLDPTLDHTFSYRELSNGAKRIRARGGGLKAYLADNRIATPYSTLMRYKLLATRLRLLLQLDQRLPLDWLLPHASPDRTLPSDLRGQYHAARRRIARLLRENPNFSRLHKHVDAKLGIPELLRSRRNARDGKSRLRMARRADLVIGATRHLTPDAARTESTRHAFLQFLQEKGLPPKAARLRDKALQWLGSPAICGLPPPRPKR